MKVAQLRRVLEAASVQHDQLGKVELAKGLASLSNALKSQDKIEVRACLRKLSQ
jgi:hypothetical protein